MSLPYGLLGLLNYYPMSGYDLKKIFDDSINNFWAAKSSQIYRELKTLEKNGDITSKTEPSNKGPNRRVYSITKQGKTNLLHWLNNPPEEIREDLRNSFLIRILLSSEIGFEKPNQQIAERLKSYQEELQRLKDVEKRLEEYLKLSGKKDHLPYWKIVLRRGQYVTKANIQWAKETLEYIKTLK